MQKQDFSFLKQFGSVDVWEVFCSVIFVSLGFFVPETQNYRASFLWFSVRWWYLQMNLILCYRTQLFYLWTRQQHEKCFGSVGYPFYFFSKALQIFIGSVESSVFQLTVHEYYEFCAFHDLKCMSGTEGCSVLVSLLCAHPWSKREMQGTRSNKLKDVEHTLWRELILIGDKWGCIWRELFTSWQDSRNAMGSSNFLTVNF